jgi:integrase
MRMPKIEQRNGKPSVRFKIAGICNFRYTGKDEADCARWWSERHDYIKNGIAPKPQPVEAIDISPEMQNTIGALFIGFIHTVVPKRPKSARTYRAKLKVMANTCAFLEKPPSKVEPADIEKYLATRGETVCKSVLAFELGLWRRVFDYARRNRLFGMDRASLNPADDVEKIHYTMRATKLLRDADRERLFSELKATTPIHDIAMFSLLSGMRPCEVVAARVRDIDFEDRLIVLADQKNNERFGSRSLETAALDFLRQHIAANQLKPGDRLFPWSQTIGRISQHFTQAARRAGLEGVTLRSMRTTFATASLRKTKSALITRLFTGHKDLQTLDRRYNMLLARDAARLL